MKRILSISLLLLALLIAVQPALAFHFCAGKLASIEFLESQGDDHSSCPDDYRSVQDEGLYFIENSCCHTSVAKLSIDDYDYKKGGSQVPVIKLSVFLFVKDVVMSLLADNFTSRQTSFAPPELLSSTGREILTRICVFII